QEVSRVVEQIPDLVEQRQAIVEAFTPTTLTFQHEKVIEKAYPVNRKHQLSIDNRYGRISVHNWNRNEAKVTITVRTAEGSEKRAQEALDRVRIEESTEGNVISLKTDITASGGSWWSSLTGESGDRAL